jgi:hypothetical protein
VSGKIKIEAETCKLVSYHLATYKCKMRNDKRDPKTEKEEFPMVAIRYPGSSLATGSAGFLFWQSNHLFVL